MTLRTPRHASVTTLLGLAALILALAWATGGAHAQQATLRVDPARQELEEKGEEFTVDVVVEDVTNLAGFQFSLEFDSGVLKAETPELGPFLESTGREANCPNLETLDGIVRVVCVTVAPPVSLGGTEGAEGTGILATIAFTGKGGGETTLELHEVQLVEAEVDEKDRPLQIPVTTEDGWVKVPSGGFPWVLWGPVIGVGAVVIIAALGFGATRARSKA